MQMGIPLRCSMIEAEKNVASEVVDLLGINYIVLHKKYGIEKERQFLSYVLPIKKIHEDDTLVAYKTNRRDRTDIMIDMGTEKSIPYLFRGWINGQKKWGETFA
jgi:hypothetical protein